VARDRVRFERFSPAPAAPAVAFAHSGVETRWDDDHGSLLELAEISGVPVASGCRAGACHGCRVTVLRGSVRHEPAPPAAPPDGTALLCCARPDGDVTLAA
jgi:ferredoxin